MKTKALEVGDQLWSEGSWKKIVATVISVTDDFAQTDKGFFFKRRFSNGDGYIKKGGGLMIDFQTWYLLSE